MSVGYLIAETGPPPGPRRPAAAPRHTSLPLLPGVTHTYALNMMQFARGSLRHPLVSLRHMSSSVAGSSARNSHLRYLLVLDFEATCGDGVKNEIIEFPTLLYDLQERTWTSLREHQ